MARAAAADPPRAGRGRPPKLDDAGVATRERLLAAAAEACVEHGFDAATVADIARRAGVSAPAIYNHFGGKVELMVAAGRAALAELATPERADRRPAAGDVARAFLADSFAPSRRLLVELHLAAQRHPEVAELLSGWHAEQAARWRPRGRGGDATVKTFFALLLGLCQVDALGAVAGRPAAVAARAAELADVLFPADGSTRSARP